jgi:UDPglucose 6-dehydrogenase
VKITIIGTGYVGLVTGVCISEFGFDVTCVDKNETKIRMLEKGKSPIYEPGIESMLQANAAQGRLHFNTDTAKAAGEADVVVVAVDTPTSKGGDQVELGQVYSAVDEIAPVLRENAVVIIKCTVVPGTTRKVLERIRSLRPGLKFSVVSNPEFLREGSAIEDFMNPDRVVIGVHDHYGREVAEHIYRPLALQSTPIRIASLEDAEISKYASNAFLAMKISFINEIADLCEKTGANIIEVSDIVGLDTRIGDQFLRAGPGYGGACFPKDTKALAAFGRESGAPQRLVEATITANETRKFRIAQKIVDALGDPEGKTVAVLGVAFKANTDDIRESPALAILDVLQGNGIKVRAFDPQAMRAASKLYPEVTWCDDPYKAAQDANAVVIVTDWNVLRALELMRLKSVMAEPLMIDLRNIHRRKEPAKFGFTYISIGRDVAEPADTEQEAEARRLRAFSG